MNNDKNKNFKISGFIENEKIEVPKNSPSPNGKKGKNPFLDFLNNAPKDLDVEKIVEDFLRNMLSSSQGQIPRDLQGHLNIEKDSKTGLGKISMDEEALNFILGLQQPKLNPNNNFDPSSLGDEEPEDDKVNNDNEEDEISSEELDSGIPNIVYDETTNSGASNLAYNFSLLANDESFGKVECKSDPNLYELFKFKYGDGPVYLLDLFKEKMIGYNLIAGLSDTEKLEYIEHTDKYILFKSIPFLEDKEPFIIGIIFNNNEFEMIIPQYGNTYDQLTNLSFDRVIDSHLFKIDKEALTVGELNNPIDLNRIRVGLEMVLFTKKFALMTVQDFGEIFSALNITNINADNIKIGKIKARDTKEVIMFKQDFNLDLNEKMFDFYIRLGKLYSTRTINSLIRFLSEIDFKTNEKILLQELKADKDGNLYIDLDLDGLPDNIDKWIE